MSRIYQYPVVTEIGSDDYLALGSATNGSRAILASDLAPVIGNKTITERGTYKASDDNMDGYGQVTVDIPYTDIHVASGDIATFEGEDLPLKSLKVAVAPYQDLHGYDAPWAGGAGKNKLQNVASSTTGITVNTDGRVVINGTFSNILYYRINTNVSLKAGTYTLSGKPQDAPSGITLYDDGTFGNWTSGNSKTFSEDVTGQIMIRIQAGTYSNVTISPMIEEGNQATAFAPYSNICPISGWDEAVVNVSGKNLFDYTKITAVSAGSIGDRNGTLFNKVGTYSVNAVNSGSYMYVRVFNSDGSIKSTYNIIVGTTITPATFTISSGEWFVVYDANPNTLDVSKGLFENWQVQVELSNQPTTYSPYNGATYTIDLDGTRYGGTLDVTSGTMTLTHGFSELSEDWAWNKSSSYQGSYYIDKSSTLGYKTFTPFICSHAGCANTEYDYNYGECLCQTSISFWLMEASSSIQDWKNYIAEQKQNGTPITIRYKLATPITVQLAPTQVKSIEGTNNIFANCGAVDVEYQTVWVRPTN